MPRHVKRDLEAERRKRRKGILLHDRGVTRSTLLRYFLAVRRVMPSLEAGHGPIDKDLSDWVEQQYLAGKGITVVSDALSGIHHFCPGFRGQLQESWRLFGIWRRIERPRQAPPLPVSFLLAMMGKALAEEKLALCCCLGLAFWGMLRTGELLQLQLQNILCSNESLVIQLGFTKTGLRRAIDENVVIQDPLPLEVFKTWSAILRHHGSLHQHIWPFTAEEFRKEFRRLISFFSLPTALRPYSLRRGGATFDFHTFGQMERTLLKGRWGTSAAARHYVQEGLSEITRLQIPPSAAPTLLHFANLVSLPSSR